VDGFFESFKRHNRTFIGFFLIDRRMYELSMLTSIFDLVRLIPKPLLFSLFDFKLSN
jgi:hypothetical protein